MSVMSQEGTVWRRLDGDVRRGLLFGPKKCTVSRPPTFFNGTCLSDVIRENMGRMGADKTVRHWEVGWKEVSRL